MQKALYTAVHLSQDGRIPSSPEKETQIGLLPCCVAKVDQTRSNSPSRFPLAMEMEYGEPTVIPVAVRTKSGDLWVGPSAEAQARAVTFLFSGQPMLAKAKSDFTILPPKTAVDLL